MAPIPSPRDAERRDVVGLLQEALEGLELEPRLIHPGRVEALRGGVGCFELEAGKGIDAAVLLSRSRYGPHDIGASRTFYRVDYAVRGSIRGILPRRIVSKTVLALRGLIRKRVVDLKWEIPPHREGDDHRRRLWTQAEALPPGPGELWDGGPHQRLTEALNQDAGLTESLESFVERGRGSFLSLSVLSDGWGESIRIRGSLWFEPRELSATYAAPPYLRIVDRIGGHIKDVRRIFGGISF